MDDVEPEGAPVEDPPIEEDTSAYLADLPFTAPVPPRRAISGGTAALLVAVVAGLGFLGGVKVQQHQGGSGSGATANLAAFAAARQGQGSARLGYGGPAAAGGAGATAAGGGFGGAGGATVGQVKLVDGDVLYVTTTSGDIVKVRTGTGSAITRSSPATAGDIRPGDTVVVQGTAGSDGTVEATRVTDSGAGGASRGG